MLPVIQGATASDYARHVRAYGKLLKKGQYTAVGSLQPRDVSPYEVQEILEAIHTERADLKLHALGIAEAAMYKKVRVHLESSDSMKWSRQCRDKNRRIGESVASSDISVAKQFFDKISSGGDRSLLF